MADSLQTALDEILAEAADIADVVCDGLQLAATEHGPAHEWVGAVDERIDALLMAAIMVLTRERPFATDLRVVLSGIRSCEHLRRSASLVGHLHTEYAALEQTRVPAAVRAALDDLHQTVAAHFAYAVAAFRSGDVEWATDVETTEARVDTLAGDVIEGGAVHWVGHHDEVGVRAIIACGLLGRFLERLGDHATALGREVVYMRTAVRPT